ncbi:MAG TPA: nucleotidyltransferase family protein [Dongiaceae bacterium]|nr:nucleotidyltransferase family protein [Dongiaceae bacterium]
MRTVAILLAAGDSRRMGTPKALLTWRGRPLLEHQIEVLGAGRVEECIVVLGRDADRLAPLVSARPCAPGRARVVRNPRPDLGRSSSVRTGLEALTSPAEAFLFVSVDQPLDAAVVEALIAAAASSWRGVAVGAAPAGSVGPGAPPVILLPTFEGRRGHPILMHGALLPELLAVGEASKGLRGVIRARPERVLEVPCDSPGILIDLNTPEDAARAGAALPPRTSSAPIV